MERLEQLEYDLDLISKANPYAAINYIRRGVGYDSYLEEYAQYRRMKPEELLETLTELQESARGFQTFEEWFAYMEEYRRELEQQKQLRERRDVDGVMLATMHSAKGLEYEVVILPDVNEGITPYKKAVSEEEYEEERRMFYVAMTRAKRFLHVFSVKRLHGKEVDASRFLEEMAVGAMQLPAGTHVEHAGFGKGIVVAQDRDKVRIYFERLSEERVLSVDMCRQNNLLKVL